MHSDPTTRYHLVREMLHTPLRRAGSRATPEEIEARLLLEFIWGIRAGSDIDDCRVEYDKFAPRWNASGPETIA